MKIDNDSLRIRSARIAAGYVGEENGVLTDDEGFVDTGNIVERRGDRYYFLGRRHGGNQYWRTESISGRS